jgi:hypothetical protein
MTESTPLLLSEELPLLPNGIRHIALSFSGGGFRAAAFTLGCASYLNSTLYDEAPLLHKVNFISSASGGTFTNLVLCAMLRQGKTFDNVYAHLMTQMQGSHMLDNVFKLLTDDSQWTGRPEKNRNLINAFSMVYDRDLFQGETFGVLWKSPPANSFVVEDTCVNTTEFDNGLNFRFANCGVIGNQYLFLRAGQNELPMLQKIKLADILACSSCFTAGFEPVMFPHDFTWRNGSDALPAAALNKVIVQKHHYDGIETDASVKNEEIQFGFMDGGIDDNQGIYAFLLADNRKKGYDYDLYLPCDVTSNYLGSPFKYPSASGNPALIYSVNDWKKKIASARNGYILISLLLLLAGIALACFSGIPQAGYVLSGIAVAMLLLPLVAIRFIKNKVKGIAGSLVPASKPGKPEGTWALTFKKHVHTFLSLPLSQLLSMLVARATSVLLLADTVYLKKIRRASYSGLFADKSIDVYQELIAAHNQQPLANKIDAGRLWKDHIAMTAIYLLSTKNNFMLLKELDDEPWDYATATVSPTDLRLLKDVLMPSPQLRAAIDLATGIDTTLWFDTNHEKENALANIVAAGQATACFNLLRITYRFGNTEPSWQRLKGQLINDWDRFQQQPFWLYNQYGKDAPFKGFSPL